MKKIKTITVIILALAFMAACVFFLVSKYDSGQAADVTGSESFISALFYQESAEVAAQYSQAYKLARLKLDEAIEENGGTGENLCIMTDIDATLTDDSSYIAGELLSGLENGSLRNDIDWNGYYKAVASEAMSPVPGAQEFVSYAHSKGVKVFFITNRPFYELDLTVKQLERFGFIDNRTAEAYSGLEDLQDYIAYDDAECLKTFEQKVIEDGRFEIGDGYFTLKGDYTVQVEGLSFSSDKAKRRSNAVKKMGDNCKVVLYLGDSINDMISTDEYKYTDYTEKESNAFNYKQGNNDRADAVMDELWKDKWGTEFIVMPNSVYGDWTKAYGHNANLTDSEFNVIKKQLGENSYLDYEQWYDGPSPVEE